MFILIVGLILVAAVLLVLIVLAQNSKGGGLTSQFGGSGASNMIGVQKTGDLLEKITWGLIIAIFVLTLSTNFILDKSVTATDEFRDRAQEQNTSTPTLDLGGSGLDPEGIDAEDNGTLEELDLSGEGEPETPQEEN